MTIKHTAGGTRYEQHGTPRQKGHATVYRAANGWGVHCWACHIADMTGLSYSGAVNLAETHNRETHGSTV